MIGQSLINVTSGGVTKISSGTERARAPRARAQYGTDSCDWAHLVGGLCVDMCNSCEYRTPTVHGTVLWPRRPLRATELT